MRLLKNALLLLSTACLTGCAGPPNKTDKKSLQTVKTDAHPKKTSEKELILNSTSYTKNPAPITRLPFGVKFSRNHVPSSSYYTKLIYHDISRLIGIGGFDKKALSEIKLYKLPPIKKLDWINIAAQDSITCKDGTPFNTVFKINKYRYRLPDKDGLEYYYMCDYDVRHAEFPATVVMNCKTFLYDFYGILIVYNRNEESAKVLPIYFDTFGGDYLTYSRHFYIDSKFTIHVIDSAVGEESIVLGNRYDISILPDGNVANHIKK